MEVKQHELLELHLSGVEPAAGIVIAIRAALRTLPLLMFYSDTRYESAYPTKPFGFWPDAAIQRHLKALLHAQGLNIFLAHEDFLFYRTALEAEDLLKSALKSIAESIRDLEITCRAIEENMESYPYAQDVAHLASNELIIKSIGGVRSIIFALHKENSQRVSEIRVTEHAQLLARKAEAFNDCMKDLAAKAAGLYTDAAAHVKQNTVKGIEVERERRVNVAMADAAHVAKRFRRYAELASGIAPEFDNDIALVNFANAANVASDAFDVVEKELKAGDLGAFTAAIPIAFATAENYENSRIAILPFYEKIPWDLYVDVDSVKYESVQFIYDEDLISVVVDLVFSTAEKVTSAFAAITDGKDDPGVMTALDEFNSACAEYEYRLAISERIFGAANNASDDFFSALQSYEDAHKAKLMNADKSAEIDIEKDIYNRISSSIISSREACEAEVGAYSKYDTNDISIIFNRSLLSDIEFAKYSFTGKLMTQQLWMLPDPELETIRQFYLNGRSTWQHLWLTFKREALIVAPYLNAWLDWYDDLFSGNSFDIKTLNGLLESTSDK